MIPFNRNKPDIVAFLNTSGIFLPELIGFWSRLLWVAESCSLEGLCIFTPGIVNRHKGLNTQNIYPF